MKDQMSSDEPKIPVVVLSSTTTIRFANKQKRESIGAFVDQYTDFMQKVVDFYWDQRDEKIPAFIPTEILKQLESPIPARAKQCAAKQALAILRGSLRKHKQREFRANEMHENGEFKKERKLREIIESKKVAKPNVSGGSIEIDSRFLKHSTREENGTTFDEWVVFSSGDKNFISLPVRYNRHYNRLVEQGYKRLNGIRISKKSITFLFEKQVEAKTDSKTLGIDIGYKKLLCDSSGVKSETDNHGHTMESIIKRLSRKKRGSKAFQRTVALRKNYIGWCLNQLNLEDYSTIRIEKIRKLRLGKRTSRLLSHWDYKDIFDRIKLHCSKQGVLVKEVNPTYTSQRCSLCGWTRKRNRNGERFKCSSCGFEHDADLNAAVNISLDLPAISKAKRLQRINMKGFYWFAVGQAPIVPAVQQTS